MQFQFIKLTFLGLLLLASSLATAGNKVGNGGNVLVCKTTELLGAKMILLDFYENDVVVKSSLTEAEAIAAEALAKLKTANPKLAAQYAERLKSLPPELDFKKDIELKNIPDSDHLFTPPAKDCDVVQTVIRKKSVLESEKRFLVRKEIWEALPAAQKAGLLTHEIIYEHLAKLGEENSVKARRVNGFLYGKDVTAKAFWKLMKDLELPIYP
jgi:hypothetical protein